MPVNLDVELMLAKQRETVSQRRYKHLQDQIDFHRTLIADTLAHIPRYPENKYAGRGIVTIAGGQTYFSGGYVLCKLLRHLGCKLPIQVWFLDRSEMDPYMQSLIEGIGPDISCVDASVFLPEKPPHLGGWECKVYSILHCPWQEVLFLDSDQVPVKDPTYLFDTQEYEAAGTILWPDFYSDGGWDITTQAFKAAGLPFPKEGAEFYDKLRDKIKVRGGYIPVESGQLLIDKKRSWTALQICKLMNIHSNFWYQYIYGDKSTFYLAWNRTHTTYAVPPSCGWLGNNDGGCFLQKDFTGEVVFQHRCQPVTKWDLLGYNKHPEGFVHGNLVDAYLSELRQAWRGETRYPGPAWKMLRNPQEIGIWTDNVLLNTYRLPERFPGNSVVLDIGGHVGCFASECLTRGAMRVFSVEPDDFNFQCLCQNMAEWGDRSVRIHAAALDVLGHSFITPGTHTGENYLHTSGQFCLTIPFWWLIGLCGLKIHTLKLDCEGSEWVLLRQDLSRVQNCVGEWHTPEMNHSAEELQSLLEAQGFTTIEIQHHPELPGKLGQWWASRA
jgi:FkbM family methyltransferase